jgi:hypothetical protein
VLNRSIDSGAVAQLGERLNGIQEADGSIPFSSTKENKGVRQQQMPDPFSSLSSQIPDLVTIKGAGKGGAIVWYNKFRDMSWGYVRTLIICRR